MDHDDILHLEAQEFMRNASDDMLELVTLDEIDLNALAARELRGRMRPLKAPAYITTRVREFSR
jgi:hypothetical protein